MDSQDGIIDAEADVQRRLHQSSSTTYADLHRAEHATLIAHGGFHHDHPEDNEQMPLLSRPDDVPAELRQSPEESSREEHIEEWPGQKDLEGLPWWKRPSIFWVIGPFLLYTIAYGGIVVPKINLIQDLLCRDYYMKLAQNDPDITYTPIMFGQDDSRCTASEIESAATNFMTACSLISGILSAIVSPKLGELSDYYGRKMILSYVVCGSLVSEIFTVFAASYLQTFPVHLLWIGFACEGLSGSFIAGMALSNAYASDCTAPSRRNVAFGYFHGCLFTGVALGPLAAAYIIKLTHSLPVIFYIALAFHLVFVIFLICFIPESLSKRRQLAAREKRKKQDLGNPVLQQANPGTRIAYGFVSLFRPLKVFHPTGSGSSTALRRNLVVLAAIDTIVFGVAMGSLAVITIYVRKQFQWDVAQQSEYMSAVNISRVCVLIFVMPVATRLVRGRASQRQSKDSHGCDSLDLSLIRLAIVFDTLGYLGYTLSRIGPLFTLSGIVASWGGMASPTLQSSLTKHVPHDRTGELLGATGLLHALARVVAPVVFNSIFAKTNDRFRQTVFVCLTATFGVALLLTLALRRGVRFDDVDAADAMNTSPNEQEQSTSATGDASQQEASNPTDTDQERSVDQKRSA